MQAEQFPLQGLMLFQDVLHIFRYLQQNKFKLPANESEQFENIQIPVALLILPKTLQY